MLFDVNAFLLQRVHTTITKYQKEKNTAIAKFEGLKIKANNAISTVEKVLRLLQRTQTIVDTAQQVQIHKRQLKASKKAYNVALNANTKANTELKRCYKVFCLVPHSGYKHHSCYKQQYTQQISVCQTTKDQQQHALQTMNTSINRLRLFEQQLDDALAMCI